MYLAHWDVKIRAKVKKSAYNSDVQEFKAI